MLMAMPCPPKGSCPLQCGEEYHAPIGRSGPSGGCLHGQDPKRHFATVYCRTAKGLFDHLVGRHEQARRHCQAKRLRRFEIKDRFVFCRRLHRKIGGLGAAQYAIDVICRLSKQIDLVNPVAHEATGRDPETGRIDRRQAVLGRERDDEIAMQGGRVIRRQEQAAGRHAREGLDGALDAGGVPPLGALKKGLLRVRLSPIIMSSRLPASHPDCRAVLIQIVALYSRRLQARDPRNQRNHYSVTL
jgi:hypothetical protein